MAKRKQFSPKFDLMKLYNGDDEDYVEFFDYIAEQEHQGAIDVETIKNVIRNQNRVDAIIVAQEMEKIGVGKFVIGRRGASTRLEWRFRSDSVGQVARGDIDELVSLASEDEAGEESTINETSASAGYIVHSFRLRPEESVSFKLPSDLSQMEASRLSDFIKSLPFE